MSLLFDAPLIAGLSYCEDVIGSAEEQSLIDHLAAADLSPFRFHGWLGNRKTQSFGWRYDFDDASFSPAEPIPEWLTPVRETAARFAGVESDDFVHVLLARYDPDAGIGWHRDRDVFEQVVGISLATAATLRFRRRKPGGFDRVSLLDSGVRRELSSREFLALPLHVRVRYLLDRSVQFFLGRVPIERKLALESLRRRRAQGEA